MEIMIIDFDSNFSQYIKKWLKDHPDSAKDMDMVEMMIPEIYSKWLDSPQEFLSGKKPSEYFLDFEAKDLVTLMIRYEAKRVGVPDPLLDAISSKKEQSLPYLEEIVFNKESLPSGVDASALQITALNLIEEIDSSAYTEKYIEFISEKGIDEGIAECMVEAIKQNAKSHKPALVKALNNALSTSVKIRLLDILCAMSFEQSVYDELISLFKSSGEKALFASYLGKYGHPEAVKTLKNALDWININYLDYIEIRNAIEELGDDVTHVRNFDGDKYYESMKGLNNE